MIFPWKMFCGPLWPVVSLWPLVVHASLHLSIFVASWPSCRLWLFQSQSFRWLWSLFSLSLFAVSQTIQYQCSTPLLSKCYAYSIVSLLICLGEKVAEFSIPSFIHSFLHSFVCIWPSELLWQHLIQSINGNTFISWIMWMWRYQLEVGPGQCGWEEVGW